MYDINTVSISGNLTGDPVYKELSDGGCVLNFQIASDATKRNDGNWEKYTNFFTVSVFGNKCKWLVENLKCGDRVVISGQLSYSQWIKNKGDRRSKVEIIADNVVLGSRKENREE